MRDTLTVDGLSVREIVLLAWIIAAFVLSLSATFFVTPLTSRLATTLGILDRPGGHKSHAEAVPYLGGVAIFTGLVAGCSLLLFISRADVEGSRSRFLFGVVLAVAIGLVGLLDDLKSRPLFVRLGAQVVAAVVAWGAGFRVTGTPWDPVDLAVTLFWIVGITNAFNLLDNMDGLSAGIAAVGASGFAMLGAWAGLPVLTVIAVSLGGASFGFLLHNRHPAKIFMGDAGSVFLGFLLSLIGIRLKFNNLLEVTFLVPVVVLGLPIFDTVLVVIGRLRHGRSPFQGGRDHVSHRLVRVGLPVTAAVGLMYWAALCLAWLGLVISRANVQVGWMLLGFVIALGLFFGALLWRVPVYEDDPRYTLPPDAIDPDELVQTEDGRPARFDRVSGSEV